MTIKAVFFDAAGTLIRTARPVGESYASIAKKYGVEVSPGEATRRFRECFCSAPPLAFPPAAPGEIQTKERQWWRDLVCRVFEIYGPFDHFEDCFSELFTYFSRAESWSLYPEVVETLKSLKERGLTVGVVSNFDSRLLKILEGLGLNPWIDSIVISSRAGFAKPSPEIFRNALALHDLEPLEAIHVGDSLEKDVLGARTAGLGAVWLDRTGKATSAALPRIANLRELFPLIGAIP